MAEYIKTPEVQPVGSKMVDTFAVPAAQPKRLTELEGFVTALAPAMKVLGDERLKEKARRDADIAKDIAADKAHQLDLAYTELSANMAKDYKANQSAYLEAGDTNAVVDKYRKYSEDYLTILEGSDTDPLFVNSFRRKVEGDLATFTVEHVKAQNAFNINKKDGKFLGAVRAVAGSLGDPAKEAEEVKRLFANHVKVTGGDFARVNDLIVEEAAVQAELGNFNHPFLIAAETMGQGGNSLFNNPKYQPQFERIQKAKASGTKVNRTLAKQNAKDSYYTNTLASSNLFNPNSLSEVSLDGLRAGEAVRVPDPSGEGFIDMTVNREVLTKFVEAGYAEAKAKVVNDPRLQGLTATERELAVTSQLEVLEAKRVQGFYLSNGIVPPEIELAIREGKSFLSGGQVTQGNAGFDKLNNMFDMIEKYKAYGGSIEALTGFTKEEKTKIKLGLISRENNEDASVYFQRLQTKMPFISAEEAEMDTESIMRLIDDSSFLEDFIGLDFTNLEEVKAGKGRMVADILERATALKRSSEELLTDEQAIAAVIGDIKKDYTPFVTTEVDVFDARDIRNFSAVKIQNNAITNQANKDIIQDRLYALHNDMAFFEYAANQLAPIVGVEVSEIMAGKTGLGGLEMVFGYENNPTNPNLLDVKAYLKGDHSNTFAKLTVHSVDITRLEQREATRYAEEVTKDLNIDVEQQSILDTIYDMLGTLNPIGSAGAAEVTDADVVGTPQPVQEEPKEEGFFDEVGEMIGNLFKGYFSDEDGVAMPTEDKTFDPVVEEGTTEEPIVNIPTFEGVEEEVQQFLQSGTGANFQQAVTNFAQFKDMPMEQAVEGISKIALGIAYHESNRTLNPSITQGNDPTGAGRGVFQYESPSMVTAIKRMRAALGAENMPEWAREMDAQADATQARQAELLKKSGNLSKAEYNELYLNPLYDASKLTLDQQMQLFTYDMLQHPKADMADLINNFSVDKLVDFWANYHHKDASAQAKKAMKSNLTKLFNN